MTSSSDVLARLEALVLSGDPSALLLAEGEIEAFLQDAPTTRLDSARQLGDVQAQLGRRLKPSPLRADLLDLLGGHILRLLDDESRTDH